MSILLNTFIRCQQFDHFETLCMDIVYDRRSISQYIDHYVFAAMIDGLIKCGKAHKVASIWNTVM
eukprot:CAMPEP_0202723284 /NCGR_PEP_ID=MMETSP1385-20130828/164701_1 /ASSEMBLY_ACC=CAM_ASM_000861 /TAXON_ID=933848 /ORGANISM="Elphidium margaritaceum" /LENGTH=64 /DNA_ID=CAMNT_0049388367 /DNA_START=16 /DNA_END=207 /DNA_ORIENTATION=+